MSWKIDSPTDSGPRPERGVARRRLPCCDDALRRRPRQEHRRTQLPAAKVRDQVQRVPPLPAAPPMSFIDCCHLVPSSYKPPPDRANWKHFGSSFSLSFTHLHPTALHASSYNTSNIIYVSIFHPSLSPAAGSVRVPNCFVRLPSFRLQPPSSTFAISAYRAVGS